MPRPLPLDDARYRRFLADLRTLVGPDPWLHDASALHGFFAAHRAWFGPRTAAALDQASDDVLRSMVHVAVLAATELADLHPASREWLTQHGLSLPPWDVTVPRNAQRLIAFRDRVYGVVEWEPAQRVQLAPDLDEADRRWATALAIGIGERPQWSNQEVWRYAAYLVMGVEEFEPRRGWPDEELAARYGVPVEAVRFRRRLPDRLGQGPS
ncbi:MAG TPA: hypothetical protein VFD49_05640 [Candidatus Dormibacteraeota bacterium]|nr:hypothetical protein [Candidatus Dormibacteraeota bacterium]